jgi:hypothetical protein
VQRLLQAWFEQPEKTVRPPRLITGYDIQQEFNLQPGPVIGQLLDFVQEAQVEGELSTREEALDWVRAWLEKFTRRPGGTG